MPIQIRHGASADFNAGNLVPGELAVTTDTGELYVKYSSDNYKQVVTDPSSLVPTTRTINNKPLSSDISLSAIDVGAMEQGTTDRPTASTATVSFVSETITDVIVNPVFFDKLTMTTGEYTFSYIDYLWQYDGVAKDPNYYGITITGEPTLGDTITVDYTAGTTAASANKPAVVVETYKNETEWYRLWSDGWLEQGGVITVPAHTSHINCYCFFTKHYTNTDYQASGFIQSYISGWQCDDHAIVEKSIDKFKLRVNKTETGSVSDYTFAWETHGYI